MISGPLGLVMDEQWSFTYDAWNRLVSAVHDSSRWSFRYDGLHRRVRKIDDEENRPYDYYHNNSWQALEIRQDQEPNAYEQYVPQGPQAVWGANYIDAAVVRWHDGNLDGDLNDQGDNTLYYTYDANFNVTALVEPDGDVVERNDYDPYGSGPGYGLYYANQILFCGYRRDETGLYYVRNRYYHPRLGRWMSRDPIGYGDAGNLLAYVNGRPTTGKDPKGTEIDPDWDDPKAFPHPRSAGECCRKAKKDGWDKGDHGGVVCCDGRAVACNWHWLDASPTNDFIEKLIETCITEHETVHIGQMPVTCKACKSLYRPPLPPLDSPETRRWHARCETVAFRVSQKCFEGIKSRCYELPTTDAVNECLKAIDDEIDREKANIDWHCQQW